MVLIYSLVTPASLQRLKRVQKYWQTFNVASLSSTSYWIEAFFFICFWSLDHNNAAKVRVDCSMWQLVFICTCMWQQIWKAFQILCSACLAHLKPSVIDQSLIAGKLRHQLLLHSLVAAIKNITGFHYCTNIWTHSLYIAAFILPCKWN